MPYSFERDLSPDRESEYFTAHGSDYQGQQDDECYFDAEPLTAGPTQPALVHTSDESVPFPFIDLARQLAGNTLFSVLIRLFSRAGVSEKLYNAVHQLAQSNDPLPDRLRKLIELLNHHITIVPEHYQQILRAAADLTSLGISLWQHGMTERRDISARLRRFAQLSESLLRLEMVRSCFSAYQLNQLVVLPAQLEKIAQLLDLYQFMPEDSSFDEWLFQLAQQSVVPELIQEWLLKYNKLAARLRETDREVTEIKERYPLPAEGDWAGKINWVRQVLNDPVTARALEPYLSPDLTETVNVSASLADLVSQFPTGNSLAEQLSWTGQQVLAPSPELLKLVAQPPFSEFVTSARQQLNGNIINPALFSTLLELAAPGPSLWRKSVNIISLLFRGTNLKQAISSTLRIGIGSGLPGGALLLNSWDWYQTLPEGLSWQDTLERFIADLQGVVHTNPQVLRGLLPITVLENAQALSGLINLPVHKSWQEILHWVSLRLGREREYDWLYQRYFELSLARGVYEALQQGNAEQREAVLRDLADSLKENLALRPGSGLSELLDLLPYMPLLAGIRNEITAMPGNDSWLGIATNLLMVVEKHPNLTLKAIRLQLEAQIVNLLSEAMVSGIDAIWEQLPALSDPLRFPEADAAPAPKTLYTPSGFWTTQKETVSNSNLPQQQGKKTQAGPGDEEAKNVSAVKNGQLIISFQEADQLLDELIPLVDGSPPISGTNLHFKEYAIDGALTAGWLTTLFLFWRAYKKEAPRQQSEPDIEMQELTFQASPDAARPESSEDKLLPEPLRLNDPVGNKRYLLPSILLSVMSGATVWATWQKWGYEEELTLAQAFRELLDEDMRITLPDDTQPAQEDHSDSQHQVRTGRSLKSQSDSDAADPITNVNDLKPLFSLWNTTSNTYLNELNSNFITIVQLNNKDTLKISALMILLLVYTFENLFIMTEKKDIASGEKNNFIELFLSLLVFSDKVAKKILKSKPDIKVRDKISKTRNYKIIKKYLNNEFSKILSVASPALSLYILYNTLRHGVLFRLEDTPDLNIYLEDKHTDYEERYPGGVFHKDVYTGVEKLINTYEFVTPDDSGSVISDKKFVLRFYLDKAVAEENKDLSSHGQHTGIPSEMVELISFTGQKIINMLSTSNHDALIENAKSEILTYGYQTESINWKTYQNLWNEYGKNFLEIIYFFSHYHNKNSGPNIYLLGAADAIKKLLEAREFVINILLENFSHPEEANQQCALFILLTRNINKISNYKDALHEILEKMSVILSETDASTALNELNSKNFGFKAAIDKIKIAAVSQITKKLGKQLSHQEHLEYYEYLMNDPSDRLNNLKDSIRSDIKIREYLFYLTLNLHGLNSEGKDKDDILRELEVLNFINFNQDTLQKEALSYLITPFAYEKFTPLEQINREANSSSTSDKKFYALYNDYIDDDSRKEARYDSFKIFTLYKNSFESYDDIFEPPVSVQEYKLSYNYQAINRVNLKRTQHVLDLSGSIKIVTISNDRKYIISTLTGLPAIAAYDDHMSMYFNTKGEYAGPLEVLFKDIYQSYYHEHMYSFNKKIAEFETSSLGDIVSAHYELIEQEKDTSIIKPIKDIVTDSIHDFYKQSAISLREQGNTTPFSYILNMVPFYAVIKRLINDPKYNPTTTDMAWDIVDLTVSLALIGAKLFYSFVRVVKSIFDSAEKALIASGVVLKGRARYLAILKLATPELIKKIPSISSILYAIITFTSDTLNPLGPFIFLGSKAVKAGKSAYKKIPRRARNKLNEDNISFIKSKSTEPTTSGIHKAFGENISADFKYIDEMSDDEILAAKSQLPYDLFSDSSLRALTAHPEGQCDRAAQRVISILSNHGYKVRIIGSLAYKNITDIAPLNHYCIIASKYNSELVIDVTFEQFIPVMFRKNDFIITSWEEWCRKMTSSDKLQNSLVMVKEYESLSAAKKEIAFTDGRSYLESSYIKDPDFHTILIPPRFLKHLAAAYGKDVKLISSAEGILQLSITGELVAKNQKKLSVLMSKEIKYLNDEVPAPAGLLDDIQRTKRTLRDLDKLELLPKRVDNYLHLIKNNIIKPEDYLSFNTPLSHKLKQLVGDSINKTGVHIDNIESINEQGLAIIAERYYIVDDEKLIPITLSTHSNDNGIIIFDGYYFSVEYRNFKWDVVKNTYRHTDLSIIDKLKSGSTSPLRNRGLLNARENTSIDTPFDFIRLDKDVRMDQAKTFSHAELNTSLRGKISTATGDRLSSQTAAGPVLGKWQQGDLSDSVDFIKVSNGSSGCVAIRIPFDELPADRPVIVSAGQLSGCTMIYATDNKYFYAYHTGQKPGDTRWLTSQQGVDEIYKAHLALKGTTIPSLNGKKLTNQDLPTIFSDYQSSLVTYLGKNTHLTGNTRIPQEAASNVNTFDYNRFATDKEHSRVGLAYAVLTKNNNKINITAYSEDLSIHNRSAELRPLASQHQLLAGEASSSEDVIFNTSIDTLSDVYNSFVSLREMKAVYDKLATENIIATSSSISLSAITSNTLGYIPAPPSIHTLLATEDPDIYMDDLRVLYMKVDSKFIPFKYYEINKSGYLYCNQRAITVVKKNGTWSANDIIPPISEATIFLERKVENLVRANNVKPYSPSPGDFRISNGAGIYIDKNAESHIYIDNQYFRFNYGINDPYYQQAQYKEKTGRLTVGNDVINIFRKHWYWDTEPF